MYVSIKCVSPALNGSSVIWCFEQSDAFQIHDKITYFNTGLSQIFFDDYVLFYQCLNSKLYTHVCKLTCTHALTHTHTHTHTSE